MTAIHPVSTTIQQILSLRENERFTEEAIARSEPHVLARDKVFAVAELANSLLEKTPIQLTSAPGLNQLQGYFQNSLSELNAFVSNGNAGHLLNAASHVESGAIPQLWAFAPRVQDLDAEQAARVSEALSSGAIQAIKKIGSRRDDLFSQLADLKTQLDQQKAAVSELSQSIQSNKAESLASISQLTEVFNTKEIDRATTFSKSIESFKSRLSAAESSAKSNAESLVQQLERHRDDAARLLQVTGDIAVTSNFRKIAERERRTANAWRWITIVFFLIGISIAVTTFVTYLGQTQNAEDIFSVVIRLLYAVAITAPAWYTARESARHRTNADRATQMELELAAIGPFIELMPTEKKDAIREELTRRYFGNAVSEHTAKSPLDPDTMAALIKAIKNT